jgi:tRNA threonylcarbamoyladenosine biosynthesis protein TsaB
VSSIKVATQNRLILAVDTSSSLGSVALARGETIIKTRAFGADRGHSQRLLPAIEELFEDAPFRIGDVDLFAAVVGPGSFTGLRVALACVRGLAGGAACFGALATDVAAWGARGRGGRILAITDLFHGEVFGSVHDSEGMLISKRECGDARSVLAALKDLLTGKVAAIGGGAMKHRPQIEAAFPEITFLDLPEGLAPHLAVLASAQATERTTCRSGNLLPFYLRDPLSRGLLDVKARPL